MQNLNQTPLKKEYKGIKFQAKFEEIPFDSEIEKRDQSFLQDDENNLYEYMKHIKSSSKFNKLEHYKSKKKSSQLAEEFNNEVSSSHHIKNIDAVKEKVLGNFNLWELIKKDKYFYEPKSPRIHREEAHDESQSESIKSEEFSEIFPEEDNFVKEIKNKQSIRIFKEKELVDLKNFRELNKLPEYSPMNLEERERKLNKAKAKHSLAQNYTYLVKPQLYPTKKQKHFENTKEMNENYMYMLIKKQQRAKDISEDNLKYNLHAFENYINSLKNRKYREKLGIGPHGGKSRTKLPLMELSEENSLKEVFPSNSDEDHSSSEIKAKGETEPAHVKQSALARCCKNLSNLFLGNPDKSWASEKRIWSGRFGKLDEFYQDKRKHFHH